MDLHLYDINFFFFFNDTATTEIYTLSLHDALPISWVASPASSLMSTPAWKPLPSRSEEHTSELQSRENLVCRLLLEKKKNINKSTASSVDKIVRRFIRRKLST